MRSGWTPWPIASKRICGIEVPPEEVLISAMPKTRPLYAAAFCRHWKIWFGAACSIDIVFQ